MGLLKNRIKEARWTKHLPPGQRDKAEAILASKSFQKYLKNRPPEPPDYLKPIARSLGLEDSKREFLARKKRLAELLDRAGMDELTDYPRVGGRVVTNPRTGMREALRDPRTGLTDVERMLGMTPEDYTRTGKKTTEFSGKIPTGEAYRASKFRQFFDDLVTGAKKARSYAAKHKRPLLWAGAGAGAVGLGLLGLQASTKDRHKELRGKT